MRPEIIKESPVTIAEARADLNRVKKRDSELTFRAAKADEYFSGFAKVDEKCAKEMFKKIEALNIPRLKDVHICKMIDLMPASLNEIKSILFGSPITIKDENLKKILEVLSSK